jgi:hypothetical protein
MVDIDKSSAAVSLDNGAGQSTNANPLRVAFREGKEINPENLSTVSRQDLQEIIVPEVQKYLGALSQDKKRIFTDEQVEKITAKFAENVEKYFNKDGQLDGDKFFKALNKAVEKNSTAPAAEADASAQNVGSIKNIAKTALKNAPALIGALLLDEVLLDGRMRQGAIGSLGNAAMAAFVMSRFSGGKTSFSQSLSSTIPMMMGLQMFMGGGQAQGAAAGITK